MSTLEPRTRADARRNRERILDAAAELLAVDPGVGLERIADRARVSRATLYHHFAGRDALLDDLTDRSIDEVATAVNAAHPDRDAPGEALPRVLRAAWEVIGRYRGLVLVNPRRIPQPQLRARLAPALGPIVALLERGQRSGSFDPELPVDWLLGAVIDLVHAASRQVSAGAMSVDQAERALLRSVAATLASHQRG